MLASYPISSSSFGEGQIENSFKTPLGKHKILTKIGTNVEKNTIFLWGLPLILFIFGGLLIIRKVTIK